MALRTFQQIDVFGSEAYKGNPLAVVGDGEGLSDAELHGFARWTNLSETTFLLPPRHPSADYRVRIFTASQELPFAGHPTLGTCHAWLADHPDDDRVEFVQECAAGLIRIRRTDDGLAFAAPPLRRDGPVDEVEVAAIADDLGIAITDIVAAQWADNGPGWIGVLLRNADAVLSLRPSRMRHRIGVAGRYPDGSSSALEVRALVPGPGGAVIEDPVTGSLNAALAQWLTGSGRLPSSYVATQGRQIGAAGRIVVTTDNDGIWIAGRTETMITGIVNL